MDKNLNRYTEISNGNSEYINLTINSFEQTSFPKFIYKSV